MKKVMDKKLYLLIVISLVLFLVVSILSFVSIKQLQGNARVVNYDGIVRGATQKLMKMELQNAYSGNVDVEARDALRSRLDSILGALDTGKGTTEETASIIKLDDATHSEMIDTLIVQWADLKSEIDNVRDGEKPDTLYALSEDYFKLANDTVFAAEAYSEKQVDKTQKILIGVDSIFILVIVIAGIFIARSMAVRKRADALGKIAYVDPLTGLENRASCERMIEKLKEGSSSESLAVLMFDMNNLKLANDFLGHQGGDKIILQFAKIIDKESKDFGFIGRYGGDEFLGIFENSDELRAREYLSQVNEQINAYNSLQVNDIEKVSFAVGVATGSLDATSIDDLIYEADRNMYTNKREMKKAM